MSEEVAHAGGVLRLACRAGAAVTHVNRLMAYVAAAALVAAMLAVVASVVLPPAGLAFVGVEEIVSWCTAIAIAFSIAYTQQKRGHVALDLLVSRLPRRARAAVAALVDLVGAALFALTSWKLVEHAQALAASGSASETLRTPFYPFVLATALGTALLALTLVVDCLARCAGLERGLPD